jgi:hypothetical protein
MRLSTAQIITIALLPVAFVCVLVDVNQLTQRSSAQSEAMEHGLGLKRTTLVYKMKRLGIFRPR